MDPGQIVHNKRLATDFSISDIIDEVTRPVLQPPLGWGEYWTINRRPFLMAWFEIVEEYVLLRFTHRTDRMIAIAGIVHRISQATVFDCYYGLWHDIHDPGVLLAQLLWMTRIPNPSAATVDLSEPVIKRPSKFSWIGNFGAPVEHCITFHPHMFNMGTNIHDYGRSTFLGKPPSRTGDFEYLEILTRNPSGPLGTT